MLRNVAVGIDTSPVYQVPLRQALALAGACGARLHLLAALESFAGEEELLSGAVGAPNLEVTLGEEPGEEPPAGLPPYLDTARQLCHEEGVACRLHVHQGDPWPWLEEKALAADVLVVGRQTGRSTRTLRQGRTARRLLADPESPLLLCGREVAEGRSALVLYQPDRVGARALALAAEICAGLNLPLAVIAATSHRQDAARVLRTARDSLYAYQLDCDFTAVEGNPAAALLELALERCPSLVAIPAQVRPLRPFLTHPLCQAALTVPDAALLVVP